jgi:hypothetical protein
VRAEPILIVLAALSLAVLILEALFNAFSGLLSLG